jgi:hypothetical protein
MRILVVSLLLAVSFAGTARAQEDASRARAAFQRGVGAYRDGRFDEALAAFTEANRIKPNPVVLYNIAQAEAEVGRAASAILHFEQYLRDAKAVPVERRAEVKKEIARLRDKAAVLVVESNMGGAKVLVDGVLVGVTPLGRTISIDPGAHRVVVSHEGFDDFALDVAAPAGETFRVNARLSRPHPIGSVADSEEPRAPIPNAVAPRPASPPAEPAPPVAAPPAEVPAAHAASPSSAATPRATDVVVEPPADRGIARGWFWAGAGTTAALATATIILGTIALSDSSEYNDPATSSARRKQLLDSGPGMAHATDALLGATAVAAVTTLWLYFKTDWGVAPTPNGLSLAGRF